METQVNKRSDKGQRGTDTIYKYEHDQGKWRHMRTQLEQTRHRDKEYLSKTRNTHKDRDEDPTHTNLALEENTKHTIDRHDQVPGA